LPIKLKPVIFSLNKNKPQGRAFIFWQLFHKFIEKVLFLTVDNCQGLIASEHQDAENRGIALNDIF